MTMTTAETPPKDTLNADQALQQAITHRKSGNLKEAERLYLAILEMHPNHPDANYNLGALAVQVNRAADGLPFFKAALESSPNQRQYWTSYIDALVRTGQADVARQVLEQGRRLGLQGDAVKMITRQLLQCNPNHKECPNPQELEELFTLFNQASYNEMEILARKLTELFPGHGFGWKALGVSLISQGRMFESLVPLQEAVLLSPMEVDSHINLALTLKVLGRFEESVSNCRRVLEICPDLAEAHINLGNSLKETGQLTEAEASLCRGLEINHNLEIGHNNLGSLLHDLGRLHEAENSYRRALEIKTDYIDAHNNLGKLLNDFSRFNEAEYHLRCAVTIQPDYVKAYNNLGNTLNELGHHDAAETSYIRALLINPDYETAYNNLGSTLKNLNRLDEAEYRCRQALTIKPDYATAYNNLGSILGDLGRFEEAEVSYRRALEIKVDYAEAYYNVSITLVNLGRLKDAEISYRRALEIKPDFSGAYINLGNTLQELSRFSEAEACYRRALEIKPGWAEVHCNLGNVLFIMMRVDEAEASYLRALEIKPDAFGLSIHVHLMMPIIIESLEAVTFWRERYTKGITTLKKTPGSLKEPGNDCNPHYFYLAYHNENNRSIMKSLNDLFRERVENLTFTAPHLHNWSAPQPLSRRIRVGFLSENLVEHTIGNLNQGFIRNLDRNRFEVIVIHSPNVKRDAFRRNLDTLADRAISLPVKLLDQQNVVADLKLDVLFYPDIGMSPTTYFLSYARLAPVQAVTWGHPETTGLDTMDYFVSVLSFEPVGSEAHYTENLIRLNRINCYFEPPIQPDQIPSRKALGLPEAGTLYGCPQSLSKLHPDFDGVLADIANGDPTGRIIMVEGKFPAWTTLLKARWKKSFPVLLDMVLFLPIMHRANFMALQARMDILLDPIHFGGGNTFYEAMIYGTPMVTFPGPFMRSRIAAGGYWQMGVKDAPVVNSLEEYAPLALALGHDPARRSALRKASVESAKRELFEDMLAVREFESFLEASVESAGRGEKLPATWQPH